MTIEQGLLMNYIAILLQISLVVIVIFGVALGGLNLRKANRCDLQIDKMMKTHNICFIDERKKSSSIIPYAKIFHLKEDKMSDEKKVFSGSVKFEESKLVATGAIDTNKDGQAGVSGWMNVDLKEVGGEVFQRQAGEGKVFEPSYKFEETTLVLSGKLDTDKDGQPVAEAGFKFDLSEISDEIFKAIAAKKGIALA